MAGFCPQESRVAAPRNTLWASGSQGLCSQRLSSMATFGAHHVTVLGEPLEPPPPYQLLGDSTLNHCPLSFLPVHTGREGHIRLTYFGQWSEVEPQCCREAVDLLYSAPGKKAGVGLGASVWASSGATDDRGDGQRVSGRMRRTERTLLSEAGMCVFLFLQRWVGFLS